MLWPIIILVYLLFPMVGYIQYKHQKNKGQNQDYTFKMKDLRTRIKVPDSIGLMRTGIWALAFTVLSIIPLMGLPGGLFIELLHYSGLLATEKFTGEALWPMALILSFILPFGWPLAVYIRNMYAGYFQKHSSLLFWIVIGLWLVSITLFLAFSN